MGINKASGEELSQEQKEYKFKIEFIEKNRDQIYYNINKIGDKQIRNKIVDYLGNSFSSILIHHLYGKEVQDKAILDHCYLLANLLILFSDYEILNFFGNLEEYIKSKNAKLEERNIYNLFEDYLRLNQNTLKDYLRMSENEKKDIDNIKNHILSAINIILNETINR